MHSNYNNSYTHATSHRCQQINKKHTINQQHHQQTYRARTQPSTEPDNIQDTKHAVMDGASLMKQDLSTQFAS